MQAYFFKNPTDTDGHGLKFIKLKNQHHSKKNNFFMKNNFSFIATQDFFTLQVQKLHFAFSSASIENIVRGWYNVSKLFIGVGKRKRAPLE